MIYVVSIYIKVLNIIILYFWYLNIFKNHSTYKKQKNKKKLLLITNSVHEHMYVSVRFLLTIVHYVYYLCMVGRQQNSCF